MILTTLVLPMICDVAEHWSRAFEVFFVLYVLHDAKQRVVEDKVNLIGVAGFGRAWIVETISSGAVGLRLLVFAISPG